MLERGTNGSEARSGEKRELTQSSRPFAGESDRASVKSWTDEKSMNSSSSRVLRVRSK